MKRLSAALALVALTTATAHAQEALPGVYDASAVPGGLMMGYLQPFQDFLEGVSIETARPQ